MRVIHVNTARDYRGGERQSHFAALLQHRKGLDVRMALPPGAKLAEALEADGFPRERLHVIPMRSEIDLVAALRLAALCRRHGAELLHLHTAHAHALGILAARLAGGIPTVVSRRVDYPRSPGLLSRLKYERADAFIAISEAVARILRIDGVTPGKIHLVRSGIELPSAAEMASRRSRRSAMLQSLGLPPESVVVLNAGSLVEHKGQEILPRAARILPDSVRILVAGEGPLRASLEAEIARQEVAGKVLLLGHRHDLPDLYAAASVYVQPSTSEGLGTAMLDAMAWELPIVASHAGGIPEAVREGENGMLMSGRNPYLLGEALKRLASDRELAERLGARGREIAAAEFSRERMVELTMAVYEEVRACRASA